jgi:hypothetical protein
MTQLHDLRLRLLVQQESERIADSQPDELEATDAERSGDTEQAMGWFADSMRLRDVINVVTSIEIPLAA